MFLKILQKFYTLCHVRRLVYAPPGQTINHSNCHILQIYHIMPPIDAHEIFSQNHMYFSTKQPFCLKS